MGNRMRIGQAENIPAQALKLTNIVGQKCVVIKANLIALYAIQIRKVPAPAQLLLLPGCAYNYAIIFDTFIAALKVINLI